MDLFKYTAHLTKINSEEKSSKLIKFMSQLTSTGSYKKPSNLPNSMGRLPAVSSNTKDAQISSIYYYKLYVAARTKYIEMGFDINMLPKYAQIPPLHIDLEETIKEIEYSNKQINN